MALMNSLVWWVITPSHWLMVSREWRGLRLIRAEPPCWKGEIQIEPLVLGWQSKEAAKPSTRE
jgi:hypothetical protein